MLEVEDGATVTFETGDASFERLARGETVEEVGFENLNGVTGPVAVAGARPGDTLKIEVLDIRVAERAWAIWLPGFGGLGAYNQAQQGREIPIRDGRAWIGETRSVPVEPMIGCIATAPESGTASTIQPAYPHGGNMDLRELSPGATLYLPVMVEGALLSVGDLHAAMGTAEPTWIALEAAGEATLRLSVEHGLSLPFPRLRVGNETLCTALGETFGEAHQRALDQAYELLTGHFGLSPFDAYAYASARVAMRFGGPATPMVIASVPDP